MQLREVQVQEYRGFFPVFACCRACSREILYFSSVNTRFGVWTTTVDELLWDSNYDLTVDKLICKCKVVLAARDLIYPSELVLLRSKLTLAYNQPTNHTG